MTPVSRVSCRMVAPLLARYNDPDLTETERVTLSTHLLQCQPCLAQLQQYRALDGRVRAMPSMVVAARVREAVLERVAASGIGAGGAAIALPWRHAWSGMAVFFSLTTMLFAAGLTTSLAAQHADPRFEARTMANGVVAHPVTTTLLVANPTPTAEPSGRLLTFSRPIMQAQVQAQATRPAAVAATIRSVDLVSGKIVVSVGGAREDERLTIMRDTAIVRADGYPGTIADLVAGLQVQLQHESGANGGLVAREIFLR